MFNFHNYMLDCATRLKDLQHSTADTRFYRMSSLNDLEELFAKLLTAQMPALGIIDNFDGKINDNGADQLHDRQYYLFALFHRANLFDHDGRQQVKTQLKNIAFKILAKMKTDRQTDYNLTTTFGLRHLDLSSVSYKFLPLVADGIITLMVSFVVNQPDNLKLDQADWIPIPTPDEDPDTTPTTPEPEP